MISASDYRYLSPAGLGPVADCRHSDGIHRPSPGCGSQHFAGSFEDGAFEGCKSLHGKEAGLCSSFYANKDGLHGGAGPHGDQALACSVFTGLVLGKDERGSLLGSVGQHVPVQVVLEQTKGAACKYQAAGYAPPADGRRKHGAALELEKRAAQEQRGLFRGVGLGVELATQPPYMSLNFHHVLSKRGSFKVRPLAAGTEANNGQDGGSACYAAAGPSCESHRDFPSYIGTSVIITNKR